MLLVFCFFQHWRWIWVDLTHDPRQNSGEPVIAQEIRQQTLEDFLAFKAGGVSSSFPNFWTAPTFRVFCRVFSGISQLSIEMETPKVIKRVHCVTPLKEIVLGGTTFQYLDTPWYSFVLCPGWFGEALLRTPRSCCDSSIISTWTGSSDPAALNLWEPLDTFHPWVSLSNPQIILKDKHPMSPWIKEKPWRHNAPAMVCTDGVPPGFLDVSGFSVLSASLGNGGGPGHQPGLHRPWIQSGEG